jgi:hypothetical protein
MKHNPNRRRNRTDAYARTRATLPGPVMRAGAPVPITVWHTADPRGSDPVTPRTAQRLLCMLTHHGDGIVDHDNDPAVAAEARAIMRRHLPTADTRPVDLEAEAGRAALVLLRWPRQQPVHPAQLATEAAGVLRPGGHLVAVIDGRHGVDFVDLAAPFHRATAQAGLIYLQHILVRCDGDAETTFTFRMSEADLATLRGPGSDGRQLTIDGDLLVFWNPGRGHGGP